MQCQVQTLRHAERGRRRAGGLVGQRNAKKAKIDAEYDAAKLRLDNEYKGMLAAARQALKDKVEANRASHQVYVPPQRRRAKFTRSTDGAGFRSGAV